MKVFITYSDDGFKRQRNFAIFMAKIAGGFDQVIEYTPNDIDRDFYEKYKNILNQKKGGGFWLWKPYFIYKSLENLNYGDYLFYADAGSFFLKNVDNLINELEKVNQDIMGFELPLIEKQWTKKELFINMDCDEKNYYESNQIMASFFLIRKSDFSMHFFKEYLQYALVENNITDIYNDDVTQVDEFIDHRQDQSIVSLLYKKYNLKPFKDPSQRGKFPLTYGGSLENNIEANKLNKLKNGRLFRYFDYDEKYNNILYHYRRGVPQINYIKYLIKYLLNKLGIYQKFIF